MSATDTSLAGLKSVNVSGSPPAQEKLPDAVPKPKDAAPAPATNIRYKLVKVRKADGTIVTVKRPIKQESMSNEHYSLFSSLTITLALATTSSTTSEVITTTKNKLAAPTQQTRASVAQKSDKKNLATDLPAKSPNPVTIPAKIAEQSIPASHQGSSVTAAHHQSNKLASTSKVSKGISRLEHTPFKLATKLIHALDGDSDTDCGDDDDDDDEDEDDDGADDHSDDSRSDGKESDQETDSDSDDKRGDTNKTDAGKTATNKAMRYAAKDPIISVKKLKEVKSDPSLTTTLDEEEAKPLKQRYKHWSRYLIWGTMIIFPVLFIGM